ncbi:helix-turn-helix domain-containing protein [Natronomonas amylolytica]|uniref:helix-turn-helix domain-containing protein n=1 Tax=Natronomonas amylolytica TaxID=3108498 RepID=UPI00300812C3
MSRASQSEGEAPTSGAMETRRVLESVTDEDVLALFQQLWRPKTVSKLVEECGIPKSTAYRKMDELESSGLIAPVGETGRAASPATKYRRTVDEIRIRIHDSVTVEYLTHQTHID